MEDSTAHFSLLSLIWDARQLTKTNYNKTVVSGGFKGGHSIRTSRSTLQLTPLLDNTNYDHRKSGIEVCLFCS